MDTYAEVWIELLTPEQGGRSLPLHLSTDESRTYKPHFRTVGGDGEYLGVEFVDGPDDPVRPGAGTFATVRFLYAPEVDYRALVPGARFEILEGRRVIGRGEITRRGEDSVPTSRPAL